VRDRGGSVKALGVIVDRNGAAEPNFGCPFVSLIQLEVEAIEARNLPKDLASAPAIKLGSN